MIRHEGDKVVFRICHFGADEVHLAGDFNNWTIPGAPMMQVEPGVWEMVMEAPRNHCRVGYYAIQWDHTGRGVRTIGSEECPPAPVHARWLEEYEYV